MPLTDTSIMVPRSCITCDANDCEKTNPSILCLHCRTVYYCSKECQDKEWATHKHSCRDIKEMRKKIADGRNRINNDICAICLSDIKSPIELGCGHVFCFRCFRDYQNIRWDSNTKVITPCPLCRSETPDVDESVLQKAIDITERSISLYTDEERRRLLLNKALDELSKVLQENPMDVKALVTKADILNEQGNPSEAILVLQKLIDIHSETMISCEQVEEYITFAEKAKTKEERHIFYKKAEELFKKNSLQRMKDNGLDCRIRISETYEKMGDFSGALDMYESAIEDGGTPQQYRQLYSGICRCLYELGEYDLSVQRGLLAIEIDRHYPNVHKYVALAYLKKGQVDDARRLMNQAVLYEAPWDDEHHMKVLSEYNSLSTKDT